MNGPPRSIHSSPQKINNNNNNMDDGVLAGERSAVLRALQLIEELGPHLGVGAQHKLFKVRTVQ